MIDNFALNSIQLQIEPLPVPRSFFSPDAYQMTPEERREVLRVEVENSKAIELLKKEKANQTRRVNYLRNQYPNGIAGTLTDWLVWLD